MNEQYKRIKKLVQIERELNKISFKGICTGSLLSNTWIFFFNEKYNSSLGPRIKLLMRIFLLSFIKRKKKIDKSISILYFNSGTHRHHQALKETLNFDNDLKKQTYFIGRQYDDLNVLHTIRCNTREYISVLLFALKNRKKISKYSSEICSSRKSKTAIILDLAIQLVQVNYWHSFLKINPQIKLVLGDFDRGGNSSTLYSTAKNKKIKTIVIQHGTIGQYGYVPIIADKIFVWGDFYKKLLVAQGETHEKIMITGTPILNQIVKSEEKRKKVINQYGFDNKINIVLALNPIKEEYNKKQVAFFAKIQTLIKDDIYCFYIKLHPSQSLNQNMWILDDYDLKILPQKILFEDFINFTDFLLVHNSGIANEAIYYGIKTGIIDVIPISPDNGTNLNNYFDVPLIKEPSDFLSFIYSSNQIKADKMFYRVDIEATKEIIYHIKLSLK